jgi:hypothetical protein
LQSSAIDPAWLRSSLGNIMNMDGRRKFLYFYMALVAMAWIFGLSNRIRLSQVKENAERNWAQTAARMERNDNHGTNSVVPTADDPTNAP